MINFHNDDLVTWELTYYREGADDGRETIVYFRYWPIFDDALKVAREYCKQGNHDMESLRLMWDINIIEFDEEDTELEPPTSLPINPTPNADA